MFKRFKTFISDDLKDAAAFVFPVSLVLNDLKFIIVGLLAGYFIFSIPDQARDNFVTLFGDTKNKTGDLITVIRDYYIYHFFFWLAICAWSLHAWAGSRAIMYKRNYVQFKAMVMDGKWEQFQHHVHTLEKYLPRILAVFPFLIVSNAITKALCFNSNAGAYLIYGLLVFLLLTYRTKLLGRTSQQSDERFGVGLKYLSRNYMIAIYVFTFFFIAYFIAVTASIKVSQALQSMLIAAISINMWTFASMWLQFASWKARINIVLILILVFYGFSYINNNHQIREMETVSKGDSLKRATGIEEDYRRFLTHLKGDTIYMVATQGGGIRAACWTSYVLKSMAKGNANFLNNLYCISGASGGSLGAAIFLAEVRKQKSDSSGITQTPYMDYFYTKDFLAPVTAAFLAPDMLQKFLPFKCNFFDRARYLEQSWEVADTTGYFARSMYDLAYDDTTKHFPLLLLNSTWVETGQRTIIAPVNLTRCGIFNNDSYSLMDNYDKPIYLSTAVSLSARFPFLTPGGLIKKDCCHALGTFGDGGYVENTALATIIDVKDMIKSYHDKNKCYDHKLILSIVYIENGDTSINSEKHIGELYELNTVLNGFYNSWDGQDKTTASKVNNYVCEYRSMYKGLLQDTVNPVNLAFTRISLPRNTDTILPLGWVLSDQSKSYIVNIADSTVKKAFTVQCSPGK